MGLVPCTAPKTLRLSQAVRQNLDSSRGCDIPGLFNFTILGGIGATFHVGFMEVNKLKNKLLALGLGGTILAILCCFTPLLPIVLTALGLTGLLGVVYSDAVLLPILAGFLILTGYAIWRQKKQK
jgi:hypothetical protein